MTNIRAIAFDSNDELYGASYGGDLYLIDLESGNLTLIGSTGINSLSSLAINPIDGQMWATPLGGDIYKINKATAVAVLVGNTGFTQTPSIAFDSEGKFFGTTNFSGSTMSNLISIDKSTGVGTVIGSTGFSLVSGLIMKGEVIVGINENTTPQTPSDYALMQNYPNPFNPSTKISWQSPIAGHQTLKVYDVLGNEVAILIDEYRNAGSYDVDFNASEIPSGVYFYQLKSGSFVQTRKMLVLK